MQTFGGKSYSKNNVRKLRKAQVANTNVTVGELTGAASHARPVSRGTAEAAAAAAAVAAEEVYASATCSVSVSDSRTRQRMAERQTES